MLTVFLRTVILYLVIAAAMRVMGKRQIGQLEPAELVTAILISEVAAIPMQDPGTPILYGVVPLVTLLALELLMSALCARSPRLREAFCGRPSVLIRDGVPDQAQLAELRISAAELLEELRLKDVFDIASVSCAVLETNGHLSVLLKPGERAVTVRQAGLPGEAGTVRVTPLIVQGRTIGENLRQAGKDRAWLTETLRRQGLRKPGDVFLLTVDDAGHTVLFPAGKRRRRGSGEAV